MLNVYLLLGVMAFTPIPKAPNDQEPKQMNESALLSKSDGNRSKDSPEADRDWDHHDHGDYDDRDHHDDRDHRHHDDDDDDRERDHHHHDDEDGDHHWW